MSWEEGACKWLLKQSCQSLQRRSVLCYESSEWPLLLPERLQRQGWWDCQQCFPFTRSSLLMSKCIMCLIKPCFSYSSPLILSKFSAGEKRQTDSPGDWSPPLTSWRWLLYETSIPYMLLAHKCASILTCSLKTTRIWPQMAANRTTEGKREGWLKFSFFQVFWWQI